jgi:hypothetical protein
MVLDFCMNETASASKVNISFPIPKGEAKQTLVIGSEMLQFYLWFKDSRPADQIVGTERQILEKLLPSSIKLITYLGGYLQQDKASSDGLIELKAGLKLIQKGFTSITSKAAYTDDEKYTLYGLFDGLNFLFGLADFKALQSIVNEELYQGLL